MHSSSLGVSDYEPAKTINQKQYQEKKPDFMTVRNSKGSQHTVSNDPSKSSLLPDIANGKKVDASSADQFNKKTGSVR